MQVNEDGRVKIVMQVSHGLQLHPPTGEPLLHREGRHFAMDLFVHPKHFPQAGPFSVARLRMDPPFRDRFAYNRVHRRSASPLTATVRSQLSLLVAKGLEEHRAKPPQQRQRHGQLSVWLGGEGGGDQCMLSVP